MYGNVISIITHFFCNNFYVEANFLGGEIHQILCKLLVQKKMVCCLYKRVDYGTLKGHWFLKSNLKIKLTILHIKSITKRVLSVFIIFIKYFSFTNFEGLVVKYAPSFPPARARSSNFFICLLQERIKLYSLKFSYNSPWQDSVFFLSLQSML